MSLKGFLAKTLIFTFCFGFLLASPSILPVGDSLSNEAYAQEGLEQETALLIVLCNALNFLTGALGRTLAALLVIAVGFGFFTGKLSWGTMISTALGIAVLFGAPTIVNMITGGEGELCPETTVIAV